jgi:hypothetical protein
MVVLWMDTGWGPKEMVAGDAAGKSKEVSSVDVILQTRKDIWICGVEMGETRLSVCLVVP